MSEEWYYAKNNQQFGPISAAQINELVESGQLSADDLVWKDGMTHWQAVSRARHLFEGAAVSAVQPAWGPASNAPSVPHPAAVQGQPYGQPSAIGYYSVTSDISARTRQILRGFPAPTGPRGDWPLSDSHLAQLAEAERHRKAIRAFNNTCHALVLICVLLSVVGLLVLLASGGRGGGAPRVVWMAGGGGLAFYLGMGALFFICGRAALKARIWGPITVSVLLTAGLLFLLFAAFMTMSSGPRGDAAGTAIVMVFVLLIVGGLLWVSVRGIIAIPKFLNSPVWAQEALVNAKL